MISKSTEELVWRLSDILDSQARAINSLRQAMARNRGMFVSLGARRLSSGIASLEDHWAAIAKLEEQRTVTAKDLQKALGIEREIRVSRILPMLPTALGKRLQEAAARASDAASGLRTESVVGTRLLRMSQQVHDGMLGSLLGPAETEQKGYDAQAQVVKPGPRSGRLILGTA